MKVKTLSRASSTISRECPSDLQLHHRNLAPVYHPHGQAREYKRAVTSAKLQQMFSKPFIASFENGHSDGINCAALKHNHLSPFLSGSVDGEVKVWDLNSRKCVGRRRRAHNGIVNGIIFSGDDRGFLSCGTDGMVRMWEIFSFDAGAEQSDEDGLVKSWRHPNSCPLTSIDHHWSKEAFATASTDSVDIWSYERDAPMQSHTPSDFGWGDDTVVHLKYNPAERDVLGFTSYDRGVGLIDTRVGQPLCKTILSMKSNAIEWNPMEPMNFIVANEDHNVYLFDMRKMVMPKKLYKGHVGPVLSVSFSPTGKEFVSGGYDKTLRIFPLEKGSSRDTYHLKRMNIIRTVTYTMDGKFLISGSDDTNLRLWKARSDESTAQLKPREERAIEYRDSLVNKYAHMTEVRGIKKSHRLPKYIKKRGDIHKIQKESRERKQENRIKHSKPGSLRRENSRNVVVKKID